jgi:hypothetical protein
MMRSRREGDVGMKTKTMLRYALNQQKGMLPAESRLSTTELRRLRVRSIFHIERVATVLKQLERDPRNLLDEDIDFIRGILTWVRNMCKIQRKTKGEMSHEQNT